MEESDLIVKCQMYYQEVHTYLTNCLTEMEKSW